MKKSGLNRRIQKVEKGQALIVIALGLVGLIAFVGLAIDAGVLFLGYGNLRRAADAAALAAADQYRGGTYDMASIIASASEYLRLNGVNSDGTYAEVYTCEGSDGANIDTNLCAGPNQPKQKLIRVVAHSKVDFSFLPILGIYSANITAEATGEAATLDVVLVLDISESMAYYDSGNNYIYPSNESDPSQCNPSNCYPMRYVKDAAKNMVDSILSRPASVEEDRVSIVYFSNGWQSNLGPNMGTKVICNGTIDYGSVPGNPCGGGQSGWFNDRVAADAAIDSLGVYDPGRECNPGDFTDPTYAGPCRNYDTSSGDFVGFDCPLCRFTDKKVEDGDWSTVANGDWSTYPTTNLGGGLYIGGSMFGVKPNMDAIWVMVVLTDGYANATCLNAGTSLDCSDQRLGVYPGSTAADADKMWDRFAKSMINDLHFPLLDYCPDYSGTSPYCLNADGEGNKLATTYHSPISDINYDPIDYARDAARFVACGASDDLSSDCSTPGQGAYIYAIGLGPTVAKADPDGVPYGDELLRFIAKLGAHVGTKENPQPDPCAGRSVNTSSPSNYSCGNYFYRASGSDVSSAFNKIADSIYTRIQK